MNAKQGEQKTKTYESQILGKGFVRHALRSDAHLIAAANRLARRWIKRLGHVVASKTHVEWESRPEYRDWMVYVILEYAQDDPA